MPDIARRFVRERYSSASAAVLAGSRARGTSTPFSDYDIVLLFSALEDGAWREMVSFEGEHFEVFAHDLGTLAYFCREVDRPSGIAVLPSMVVEGVSILPQPSAILDRAREIARRTLAMGPPPLDAGTIDNRRYAITNLAVALQAESDRGTVLAVGTALYAALADFALRSEGRWSARGKALTRALAARSLPLAEEFETAFAALFASGDDAPVQSTVDIVLAPHGGRLREGYRQSAPREWSDTVPGA